MKTYALRLHSGSDLKAELIKFTNSHNLQAGLILTCVGSLKQATLRLADDNRIRVYDQKFEIVSLVGTLSADGLHLHASISDRDGTTFGGHVQEGCLIHTTAEIVIGELEGTRFSREFDEQTGYKELVVSDKV